MKAYCSQPNMVTITHLFEGVFVVCAAWANDMHHI